jgi:lysophospholipase L1-like esterase
MKTCTIPKEFLVAVKDIQPACVFIHLGGNDNLPHQIQRIFANNLLDIYDDLHRYCANVFIGEILTHDPSQKHSPGLTKAEFDHQRKKIKSYVKKKICEKLVRFKDISFPNDYHNDGIHLSPQTDDNRRCGLEKYFFTIRRLFFSITL